MHYMHQILFCRFLFAVFTACDETVITRKYECAGILRFKRSNTDIFNMVIVNPDVDYPK